MNSPRTCWERLVVAARQITDDTRDVAAPPYFAARVSALAFASGAEPSFAVLFARLAPRALWVCGLVMVLGVSLGLRTAPEDINDNDTIAINDPVAEWLDAAS